MKKKLFFVVVLAVAFTTAHAQTQTDSLSLYRAKINELDKTIVRLLGQRMETARAIGLYKMAHKIEVVQSNRFNEVLQQAINQGKQEGLSENFIKELYEAIHKESIRQQNALKPKDVKPLPDR